MCKKKFKSQCSILSINNYAIHFQKIKCNARLKQINKYICL